MTKKPQTARKLKVLVIDDEQAVREVIGEVVSESYEPVLAAGGEQGIELAERENPAVILLDIMMSGLGGIETCERLRRNPKTKHIPVIMLSAASQRENRVRSFNLGADDFINKPFDSEELLARIQAKIRRGLEETKGTRRKQIACANLLLDDEKRTAMLDERRLEVTGKEYDLLKLFVRRVDRVVTRQEIITKVWKDAAGSDRRIDAHIVALRKQLEGFTGSFTTIYGKGYMLTKTRNDI